MSSFDLPPLGGFDMSAFGRLPAVGMQDPEHQDPERIGQLPAPGTRALDSQDLRARAPKFEGVLADSLAQVQALQQDVSDKTRGLALGEDVEVHDVLIAAGKSEVAFNLMLEVRNKLVDAWEKLSRSAV